METKTKTVFCWRNQQIARIFDTIENTVLKGIDFTIAGGSVVKLYLKKDMGTSDIDLWFDSRAALDTAVEQWKSVVPHDHFMLIASTDNSFTFYCSDERFDRCFKVQMITKDYFKTMVETIRSFDFTICQMAYKNGRITMTQEAYDDHRSKVLRMGRWYNRVLCETRLRKYMLMGFTPTIELFDRAFVHGRDQMTYGSVTLNNSEFYDQ